MKNQNNQKLDSLGRIQQDLDKEIAAEKKAGPKANVAKKLTALADLYDQRAKIYGDNYKLFGKIMVEIFQGKGVMLNTAEDFNRFAIFVQVVSKVTRYGNQFSKGGHPDSLDDGAVYSMMLRELDEMEEAK